MATTDTRAFSCRPSPQRYTRGMKPLEWWQYLPADPNDPDAELTPNFDVAPEQSVASARFEAPLLGLLAEES